jgi:NADPH:quinone reductase
MHPTLREGILRPDIRHPYLLAAAADAHRDLEARRTSGQILLLP